MPSRMVKRVLRLEQTADIWHMTVRRAPAWIHPRDEKPYRPFMILVLDAQNDLVRLTQFFPKPPSTDEVMSQLMRAMMRPAANAGARYRPASIYCDNAEVVRAIAPHLQELGIACEYRASLPIVTEAVRSLGNYLSEEEETLEGLFELPGYTQPLVEEFFAAAAAFYRQTPWEKVPNDLPIEVRYPADADPKCVIVMGSGQETYGLSMYESYDDLKRVLETKDLNIGYRGIGSVALTFVPGPAMPLADLDLIEKYGWEIAGDDAYPLAVKLTEDGRFMRPSAAEFIRLTAIVRAMPDFIANHLCVDEEAEFFEPTRATFSLPPVYGGQQIALAFPPDRLVEINKAEMTAWLERLVEAVEVYIEDWYWDETSHKNARQIGIFFFLFYRYLIDSGLKERTIRTHERNCWVIGKALCDAIGEGEFSPAMLLDGPKFIGTFVREVSDSKTALKSYRATWNKLRQFVGAMDSLLEEIQDHGLEEEDEEGEEED